MSRKHHFLPDYLSMPDCPTQEAATVTGAILQLSQHPESHLARLIWISPEFDAANHAMLIELKPDLGVITFRGFTGSHSVAFRTTSDVSRAIIHGTGFFERNARYATASVTDGMRGSSWDKAAELVRQLALEIEAQQAKANDR